MHTLPLVYPVHEVDQLKKIKQGVNWTCLFINLTSISQNDRKSMLNFGTCLFSIPKTVINKEVSFKQNHITKQFTFFGLIDLLNQGKSLYNCFTKGEVGKNYNIFIQTKQYIIIFNFFCEVKKVQCNIHGKKDIAPLFLVTMFSYTRF